MARKGQLAFQHSREIGSSRENSEGGLKKSRVCLNAVASCFSETEGSVTAERKGQGREGAKVSGEGPVKIGTNPPKDRR